MSSEAAAELDALSERIERLVQRPDEVKDAFGSLAGPVMRVLRWQPSIHTSRAQKLGERLKLSDGEAAAIGMPSVSVCAKRALDELGSNVDRVERACVVHGRIPLAYATWLWRLYGVVRRVHEWLEAPDDSFSMRSVLCVPTHDVLPPLVARHRGGDGTTPVVAIDPLLRAARDETEFLGRRRRLLEAARRLLLDASAALDLDPEGLEARSSYIANEITRLDRLEGVGLSSQIGLVHQVRQALERRETQRLHAGLVALESFALDRGDGELGRLTARALDELWGSSSRFEPSAREQSLAHSGHDLMKPRVLEAIDRGFTLAEERRRTLQKSIDPGDLAEAERWRIQTQPGGADYTVTASLLADGGFEVGGTLSPVRVADLRRTTRLVRFPTPELVLAPALGVEDLPDAVIEDPRLVLLSLASGKLLARRFLAEETESTTRTGLAGEVRLYVLDGSSSMLGPRGRMRDAILVAELSTLAARFGDLDRTVTPTLYYRYFTDKLDTLFVVEDEADALKAIENVIGTLRQGSTDIESALLASFERIRIARETEPNLASAQIVLVTDGDAPIDRDRVIRARDSVQGLPVGVSIIALGQENPALRALAAHQRARGEPVFYHFTSDEALAKLVTDCRGAIPVHLPQARADADISSVVREVVDEIEMRQRGTQAEDIARSRDDLPALAELGLSAQGTLGESELARAEALERDDRTLRRRFERWFPEPSAGPTHGDSKREPPERSAREDLDIVVTLLASVAEVVDLVGSDPLRRQADAIEVFERLLCDAGLAPWRYAELVKAHPEILARALGAVRASAGL